MPKYGYKSVKWLFGKEIEIPEEWGIMKFERIAEFLAGYAFSSKDYSKKGIQLLRQGNLQDRKLNLEKEPVFLDNSFEKEYPEYIIRSRDIVVSLTGTMTKRDYGYAVLIPNNTSKLFLNQRMAKITPNEAIISEFLTYLMNHRYFEDQFYRLEAGTKQANVSLRDVKKLNLFCPAILEQKKIVSILSNVDYLISSYDDKIQTTKKLKQGLMQTLLTKGIGHKKFKKVKWLFGKEIEIPEEWEINKVGKLFKLKSGSTPSRQIPEYFNGNIPWITSTDLNRTKITDTLEKITLYAVKQTNLKILPKGTFLIATYGLEAAGTRGKCGIIEIESTCNQACMAFLPSAEIIPDFLFYFYLYFGEKIVFSIAQGTKQQNLYSDTVKKVSMLKPSRIEQQKIASILSSVDKKISELESKKTSLEKVKKGLMQKLLTGQIRVSV